MVYIKRIPSKKEYEGSYHKFCHSEGLALLQYALQKEYSYNLSEDDIRKKEHGKPYIKNVPFYFNISHCDGLVVCAVSENEIGIDAEVIRTVADRVMKRCYSDSEIDYVNSCIDKDVEFTKLWTLKESYVKLTGEGIASDLKAVSFDLKNATAFSDDVSFSQFSINGKYIVSLCKDVKSEKLYFDILNNDSDDIIILDN